jgi:tRNA (guanine37-N1)-methyltransferase
MDFKSLLIGKVPAEVLDGISGRFDVVGDIAVLSLPECAEPYAGCIAGAVCDSRKNIRTVINKRSVLSGNFRTFDFDIIRGGGTKTVHREYGFSYRVDLKDSFFTGRLSSERMRVASLVKKGESVFVPFAGVGPFAVPAAKRGGNVIAMEMNRKACGYMRENMRLNSVCGSLDVICGDVRRCGSLFGSLFSSESASFCHHCLSDYKSGFTGGGLFDRIIAPAPYGMDDILPLLSGLLISGGYIHFYSFRPKTQVVDFIGFAENFGLRVENYSACGNVAPGISRWVFDMSRL